MRGEEREVRRRGREEKGGEEERKKKGERKKEWKKKTKRTEKKEKKGRKKGRMEKKNGRKKDRRETGDELGWKKRDRYDAHRERDTAETETRNFFLPIGARVPWRQVCPLLRSALSQVSGPAFCEPNCPLPQR